MVFDKFAYERTSFRRSDGSRIVVGKATVKAPYEFEVHPEFPENRAVKLRDTAHLRMLKAIYRGISRPMVAAWDAYPQGETFSIPRLDFSSDDVVRISKNSQITHVLRNVVRRRNFSISGDRMQIKHVEGDMDRRAGEFLEMLTEEGRLLTVGMAEAEPEQGEVVAVGELGFPSRYAKENGYPLVINAAYFLFEEEDYVSDFSLFGEAYGMHINQGEILLPPLFERSALLFDWQNQASMRQVSLTDLVVHCLGRDWNLGSFTLNEIDRCAVYTRYYGVTAHGRTMGVTPPNPANVDIVIIGQWIVGYKVGGEVEIPHNGFILSVPMDLLREGEFDNRVRYAFASGEKFKSGIQCGPGLVSNGEIILDETTLRREQFYRKREMPDGQRDLGVVPTDYASDIDQTRAARTVLGVGYDNELIALAVEAVNRGMEEDEYESSGVTLKELAQLAEEHNFKHALNVDGGGSTNIQYMFGQLVRGADRRGMPGVFYERMVPSVCVIKS